MGVEPRDGDGKRDHLDGPDRERLAVLVGSPKKKDGQMPAGPDQPEQYACAGESEAPRQTGKSIAAPSDLFPCLNRCGDGDRHHNDVPGLRAEAGP